MTPGLQRLALALWLGGGLAVPYGTRAIFAAARTRQEAGLFAGAVLRGYHWLQLAALLLWFASLGAARLPSAAAALCTVLSFPVDARLHRMRDLEPADPRRKGFGPLHGLSVLLLIAQVLAAAAGLLLSPAQ